MIEYYTDKENTGKTLTARYDNPRICEIMADGDIVWSIARRTDRYTLTGRIVVIDNDLDTVFAETSSPGVFIPIINGESDWMYTADNINQSYNPATAGFTTPRYLIYVVCGLAVFTIIKSIR